MVFSDTSFFTRFTSIRYSSFIFSLKHTSQGMWCGGIQKSFPFSLVLPTLHFIITHPWGDKPEQTYASWVTYGNHMPYLYLDHYTYPTNKWKKKCDSVSNFRWPSFQSRSISFEFDAVAFTFNMSGFHIYPHFVMWRTAMTQRVSL